MTPLVVGGNGEREPKEGGSSARQRATMTNGGGGDGYPDDSEFRSARVLNLSKSLLYSTVTSTRLLYASCPYFAFGLRHSELEPLQLGWPPPPVDTVMSDCCDHPPWLAGSFIDGLTGRRVVPVNNSARVVGVSYGS